MKKAKMINAVYIDADEVKKWIKKSGKNGRSVSLELGKNETFIKKCLSRGYLRAENYEDLKTALGITDGRLLMKRKSVSDKRDEGEQHDVQMEIDDILFESECSEETEHEEQETAPSAEKINSKDAVRVNIGLVPELYDYVKTMSGFYGKSFNVYLNRMVAEHKIDHEDEYEKIVELREELRKRLFAK